MRAIVTAILFAGTACSRPTPPALPATPAPASSAVVVDAAPLRDPVPPSPPPASAPPPAPSAPPPPQISVTEARRVLFRDSDAGVACLDGGTHEVIQCLLAARYAADPTAARLATSLYETTGDVAGLSPAETMEGGFRGTLHLVPELPIDKRRKHLEWVARAASDYDDFFHSLAGDGARLPYRWRALDFRFMRSVNRTTPSAYASGWGIAYNVDGSLNTSEVAVRELLFHEIFHLNDAAHGDWSVRALGPIFDAIALRCRTQVACLAPYAPTETRVRGGTYYAFQPDNGDAVHEYAAELALRYYREQRAVLHGEKVQKPYKCGPAENARAWGLLAGEFFGGKDRTGDCP